MLIAEPLSKCRNNDLLAEYSTSDRHAIELKRCCWCNCQAKSKIRTNNSTDTHESGLNDLPKTRENVSKRQAQVRMRMRHHQFYWMWYLQLGGSVASFRETFLQLSITVLFVRVQQSTCLCPQVYSCLPPPLWGSDNQTQRYARITSRSTAGRELQVNVFCSNLSTLSIFDWRP